jgi:small subunit ribosomal protein S21
MRETRGGLHGQEPDYFVDAARCCALESAPACDSVACSALFNGRSQGGGVPRVAEVKIQEGESIESALRRFKRKVQQEDIIKDIKKHSFYLKPGDKRRAKQALARKRNRKKLRRESE